MAKPTNSLLVCAIALLLEPAKELEEATGNELDEVTLELGSELALEAATDDTPCDALDKGALELDKFATELEANELEVCPLEVSALLLELPPPVQPLAKATTMAITAIFFCINTPLELNNLNR